MKETPNKNKSAYIRFAEKTATLTGRPAACMLAFGSVLIWAVTGPFFHFSDTWQLVINTSTTIITFLMVFLIQNSQNRDTSAVHLKLDELIRTTRGAHTVLLDIEQLSDAELDVLRAKYEKIAQQGRERLAHGKSDTNQPKIQLQENDEAADITDRPC